MKIRKMPAPEWRTWEHVAKLSAEEAVALTMNFCPNTIKAILRESKSSSPVLFPLIAGASGMEFEDADKFENRLFILERSGELGPATRDLGKLATRFGWGIPTELADLATPTIPEAETKPPDDTLSENERTKLLKHIGGMALLLAEKFKVYTKGDELIEKMSEASARQVMKLNPANADFMKQFQEYFKK